MLVEASGWREVETALSVVSLPPASEEPICRVVAGTVEVPRLERWRAELVQDGAISVRIGGRYVITGGSGGLGTACAQWLLNQGAGSLILLSRRRPAICDGACPAEWLECDVSLPSALQEAIDQIRTGGPIHGIIHAAGVLADKLLAEQTPEDLHSCMACKIVPALLLPQLECEDWIVNFSSVSSVLGSAGQVAYSAANGCLDGLGQAAPDRARVLTIQWGPWAEGMAFRTEGALQHAAKRGWTPFTRNSGLGVLDLLLRCGAQGTTCALHDGECGAGGHCEGEPSEVVQEPRASSASPSMKPSAVEASYEEVLGRVRRVVAQTAERTLPTQAPCMRP